MWHTLTYKGIEPSVGGGVSAEVKIEPDSSWFSGHFPDEPILPGIALLAMAAEVVKRRAAEEKKKITVTGIKRVRFRIPVRPGALLSISVSPPDGPGGGFCPFKIIVNGETACSGSLGVKAA